MSAEEGRSLWGCPSFFFPKACKLAPNLLSFISMARLRFVPHQLLQKAQRLRLGLPAKRVCQLALGLALTLGCSDPAVTDAGTCGANEPAAVTLGSGTGDAFIPLAAGAPILLEFGSQAGMEFEVAVETTGANPEDVAAIEIELLVDGAPVASSAFGGDALTCSEGRAHTNTATLVDVGPHPTITTVNDLDRRPATLIARIQAADGILSETSVEVELRL